MKKRIRSTTTTMMMINGSTVATFRDWGDPSVGPGLRQTGTRSPASVLFHSLLVPVCVGLGEARHRELVGPVPAGGDEPVPQLGVVECLAERVAQRDRVGRRREDAFETFARDI